MKIQSVPEAVFSLQVREMPITVSVVFAYYAADAASRIIEAFVAYRRHGTGGGWRTR